MTDIVANNSSNITINWQPEPNTRGTFTLLSTCIITLTLCVWSAVHLNLPGTDRNFERQFSRRLKWIGGSLIAPEWLIFTAWSQLQAAKRISKEVDEMFQNGQKAAVLSDPESQPSSARHPRTGQPLSRRHPWTMTHSFWAVMGGIALDPSGTNSFIPKSRSSMLTAKGISLLIKHEPQLLPDISEEDIKDKSKGGAVAKFAACVQASWFCLSCITRIAQGLPVGLLEVNTFAHAFCTVIVYIIWWRKPLDVEQPFLIQDKAMKPLLAYMWMASKTSCLPKPPHSSVADTVIVGQDPEFEAIAYESTGDTAAATNTDVLNDAQVASRSRGDEPSLNAATPQITKVTTTAPLPDTGFRVNGISTRWKVTTIPPHRRSPARPVITYKPAVFNLTPNDARRWRLANEAMATYHLAKPSKNLDLVTVKPIAEMMDSEGGGPTGMAFLSSFLIACYGGLHALGWNAHFPSHRELLLWRASALIIASPGALMMILLSLVYIAGHVGRVLRRKAASTPALNNEVISLPKIPAAKYTLQAKTTAPSKPTHRSVSRNLEKGAETVVVAAMVFLYLPARGYLVYESFRTVFFLPPEAYRATSWTQYLPHIT